MLSVIYKLGSRERVPVFRESVAAVDAQSADTTTIVLTKNETLRQEAQAAGADVTEVASNGSLTWARNRGVELSSGDYVAFLDDDAYPADGWASAVVGGFHNADAVGGPLIPDYRDGAISWLPEAFHWLIGCGPYYEGERLVPNTYGSNLAIRREAFESVGGFDETIGMGSGGPGQGAETDLCRRLRAAGYDAVWYEPDAHVRHVIDGRDSILGLHRRAFQQGEAKAAIGTGSREASFLRDELCSHHGGPREYAAAFSLTAAVGSGYLRGRLL